MKKSCTLEEVPNALAADVCALHLSKALQKVGMAVKGSEASDPFAPCADKKIKGYSSFALAFPCVVNEDMYYPAVVMAAAKENAVNVMKKLAGMFRDGEGKVKEVAWPRLAMFTKGALIFFEKYAQYRLEAQRRQARIFFC